MASSMITEVLSQIVRPVPSGPHRHTGAPAWSGDAELHPDRQVVRADSLDHLTGDTCGPPAGQYMVQLHERPVSRVGPAAHGAGVAGGGPGGRARHVEIADDHNRAGARRQVADEPA